jgi:hypothetical protein
VYAAAARAYATELANAQPLGHWLADQPPLRAAVESAFAAGRAEVAAEIRAAASHWTRPSIAEWAARIAEGKTENTKEETQ